MNVKVRMASEMQVDSIVDGEGIRAVIWFQGCPHKCLGCHNPESHDFNAGFEMNLSDLLTQIEQLENQSGITLSGGEPMMQPEASLVIVQTAKNFGMSVWCWSGFTFEELLTMSETKPIYIDLLNSIDVLVDGKFVLEKKSLNIKFRGSSNQRILDLKASMEEKRAIRLKKYK